MLVLHYTGMESAEGALERLCDPAAKVSAHFLIDEDGSVYGLVDVQKRAWHAGVASWRGHSNINARSIGIELVNPGHEFGYQPFPPAQMNTLIELSRDIVARHPIPAGNIVGHSDIAPTRKQDPGELFDWRLLANEGLGLWPKSTNLIPPDEFSPNALLSQLGYDTTDLKAAIVAFQRHYLPHRMDGICDQDTSAVLHGLFEP